MNVKIKLFGAFRIDRFKEKVLELPPDTKVQEVVDKLQVPQQLLGIVLINGTHACISDVLTDGDTLSLLPLLGGG